MQYSGTAWVPIISYGTMDLYVDNTDGTDDAVHGTGVDADAFKSPQYAGDTIPGFFSGNIIIHFNAESYAAVTIQGKNPTGPYSITIKGTLTALETITGAAITAGSGINRGVINKSGVFNGDDYANKLAYYATDAVYRIIDGHCVTIPYNSGGTDDIAVGDTIKGATSGAYGDVIAITLTGGSWAGGNATGVITMQKTFGTWQNGENIDNVTDTKSNCATTTSTVTVDNDNITIVATAASSTTQNVTIYDWGTTIAGVTIGQGQKGVYFYDVYISSAITTATFSAVFFNRCKLYSASLVVCSVVIQSQIQLEICFVDATYSATTGCGFTVNYSYVRMSRTKLIVNTASAAFGGFRVGSAGDCAFTNGSILDGTSKTGCGIYMYMNAVSISASAAADGRARIRNFEIGVYALSGSQAAYFSAAAYVVYSNNTTNINAVAAEFAAIT